MIARTLALAAIATLLTALPAPARGAAVDQFTEDAEGLRGGAVPPALAAGGDVEPEADPVLARPRAVRPPDASDAGLRGGEDAMPAAALPVTASDPSGVPADAPPFLDVAVRGPRDGDGLPGAATGPEDLAAPDAEAPPGPREGAATAAGAAVKVLDSDSGWPSSSCTSSLSCYGASGPILANSCSKIRAQSPHGDYTDPGLDACRDAQGAIGSGSCLGGESCKNIHANIGNNSCNQPTSCKNLKGSVGDMSCFGQSSCHSVEGNVGVNSCTERLACSDWKGDIPDNCKSTEALKAGECHDCYQGSVDDSRCSDTEFCWKNSCIPKKDDGRRIPVRNDYLCKSGNRKCDFCGGWNVVPNRFRCSENRDCKRNNCDGFVTIGCNGRCKSGAGDVSKE